MRFEIEIDFQLVAAFAAMTGDYSSIHTDPQFARKSRFREPIVHGMLPVFALLNWLCFEVRSKGPKRLAALSCRFGLPLKFGDRIWLEANETAENSDEYRFSVTRVVDKAAVTTGKIILSRAVLPSDQRMAKADTLVDEPLKENSYAIADIEADLAEEIIFNPTPAAAESFLGLLARRTSISQDCAVAFSDPTTAAVVMASTLIGMRLPGRYATFLELEAKFPQPIVGEQRTLLRGAISEVAPTNGRMRLNLQWSQGSVLVGTGVASTMVGASPPSTLSSARIQAEHVAIGIDGKVALVTGASRGIGETTAKMLAAHGARVAVHYFRGRADAETIVDDINKMGGCALALQADLADQESITSLFAAIVEALGPVDILVNNAVDDFTPKTFDSLQAADYFSQLNVSLLGMHSCCRLALPHMRKSRRGKIINIGTVATEVPVGSQSCYITAKSAVVGYTRSLAVETAEDNIQVNMVVPSMTETSLIAGIPQALVSRLAEESPGGTLLQPIDVAKAILFLASDWSNAVSGQQLALTKGAPPYL